MSSLRGAVVLGSLFAASFALLGCATNVAVEEDTERGEAELLGLEDPAHAGSLTDKKQVLTWSSEVSSTASLLAAGGPEVCETTGCASFTVDVSLPSGTWDDKPGGVAFALRYESANDTVDLFVYKDGVQVAKDEGMVSIARSVLIPNAANGRYTIYASYTAGNSHDPVDIDVMASVEYPVNPSPQRMLLPDLTVIPHRNTKFATSANLFNPIDNTLVSCYPDEIAAGATQCLRFDQIVENEGEGPVELRSAIPLDPTDTTQTTYQRIFFSDDRSHYIDRPAAEWELHAVHGHVHTMLLAQSRLWASNIGGAKLGAAPLRTGEKTSFCLADIDLAHYGQRGYDARKHKPPGCLAPTETDGTHAYIVSGISRGWIDVYDWYLEGQYIDATGLGDGYYVLETVADPDNQVLESNESNNCLSVRVLLTNMGSATPTSTILGPGPEC